MAQATKRTTKSNKAAKKRSWPSIKPTARPFRPIPPRKPSEHVDLRKEAHLTRFYFYDEFSLQDIIDQCKDITKNFKLGNNFKEVILRPDLTYDNDPVINVIMVTYEKFKNKHYEAQLKKYKQEMKSYKEEYSKYKIDLQKWKEDKYK